MGLSERKTKQRLGEDPRNLAWANGRSIPLSRPPTEARKPRTDRKSYQTTHGSASSTLKSSAGPSVQALAWAHRAKVVSPTSPSRTKLNLLGIGGDNSNGDVSWKQNRGYELMLKRLNTSGDDDEGERIGVPVSVVPGGFVRAVEGTVTSEKGETNVAVGEVDEEERKRLRKERKRKEKAAAKGKASVAHDGTPSCVEPSSAAMDAASIISPSQPAVPEKPSRRILYVALPTSKSRKSLTSPSFS